MTVGDRDVSNLLCANLALVNMTRPEQSAELSVQSLPHKQVGTGLDCVYPAAAAAATTWCRQCEAAPN